MAKCSVCLEVVQRVKPSTLESTCLLPHSHRGYKPHARGSVQQGDDAAPTASEPPGAREAELRLRAQERRRRGEQWADE